MQSAADGLFIHAIAENANSRIRSMPASGYTSSGTQFYAHTGSANNTATVAQHGILSPISGAGVAYYLFGNDASPRYIHCVVEVTSGRFLHWSFGTLLKRGTWTGGGYNHPMFWSTASNTAANQTIPFDVGAPETNSKRYTRCDGLLARSSPAWSQSVGSLTKGVLNANTDPVRYLAASGLNDWTQRSTLAPLYAILKRLDADTISNTTRALHLGEFQDVRFISMEGRNPGDILTIGSDNWHVFPIREKPSSPDTGSSAYSITGTAPNHHTNLSGLAYRET
jgi:hypothetical protein